MKKIIIAVLCVPLLSGCRALLDAGGAGLGGLVGNKLGHGDPVITAASAGGGALFAEGAQTLASKSQQQAFKQGLEAGRAQAAKEFYWDLQERQRAPQGR